MAKKVFLVLFGVIQGVIITAYFYANETIDYENLQAGSHKQHMKMLTLNKKYENERKQHKKTISKYAQCIFTAEGTSLSILNLKNEISAISHRLTKLQTTQVIQKNYYKNYESLYSKRYKLNNEMQNINQKLLTSSFKIKNKAKYCQNTKIKSRHLKLCDNLTVLIKENQHMQQEFNRLGGQLDIVMRELEKQRSLIGFD